MASRHPKSIVLTDDRLVQRIALAEGHPVAGTLGLIMRAVDVGIIRKHAARQAVDVLVGEHALT